MDEDSVPDVEFDLAILECWEDSSIGTADEDDANSVDNERDCDENPMVFHELRRQPLAVSTNQSVASSNQGVYTEEESLHQEHLPESAVHSSSSILSLAHNAIAAGLKVPHSLLLSRPVAALEARLPSTLSLGLDVGAQATNHDNAPLYVLYDKLELRKNFVEAKRMHGLPVTAQDEPPCSYVPQPSTRLGDDIIGNQVRGNDEQAKRNRQNEPHQRINALIEELRCGMEERGWEDGKKGRFQAVSSCADYVKHLLEINREKEQAVVKAKQELETRQQGMNSITNVTQATFASTEADVPLHVVETPHLCRWNHASPGLSFSDDEGDATSSGSRNRSRRGQTYFDGEDLTSTKKRGSSAAVPPDRQEPKRPRLEDDESQGPLCVQGLHSPRCKAGGAASESWADGSCAGDVVKNKDTCHVIDEERSKNTTSSESGGGGCDCSKSSSSISSNPSASTNDCDGPVPRVTSSENEQEKAHPAQQGCVISSHQNTSELDYKEIFLRSNVPQLLASPRGRIIAWNDFFVKVTGLTKHEMHRCTIFDLVQPSHLSKLFEIVARGNETMENESDDVVPRAAVEYKRGWQMSAALPCINLREAASSEHDQETQTSASLYMAVASLTTDSNQENRCFHCVFSDRTTTTTTAGGIEGEVLGPVTSDLLAFLFTKGKNSRRQPTSKLVK